MSHDAVGQLPDLSPVRAWRVKLRHASARIAELLGQPTPDPHLPWVGDLGAALETLTRCWETHVAAAESDSGLLKQIETDAPRLSPAVARLRRDHRTFAAALRSCSESLRTAGTATMDGVRADLERILTDINQHGLEGAELIHQAYRVDIGGGE